jgi:hypothetical protein
MSDPFYELRKLTEDGYTVRITAPVFTIEVLDGDEVVGKGSAEYFSDAMLDAWMETPDREAIASSEDQRLRAIGAPELPGLE